MAQNSQDANTAVSLIEQEAAQWLVAQTLPKLILAFPWLAGLSGPAGWILGLVAGVFIHFGDLLSYIFIDDWQVSQEAKNYENAATQASASPSDQDAQQARRDAFDNLFG